MGCENRFQRAELRFLVLIQAAFQYSLIRLC
jgi:hypothetical protein